MQPFFSIIIPTFNRPEMALKALKSVRQQTFNDYESIIVNDGSMKDYGIVKKEIANHSNFIFFTKQNEGPSAARNFGIDNASGKFICFLDDDDEYMENHLQVLYNNIVNNNFNTGLYKTLTYFRTNAINRKQKYQKVTENLKSIKKIYSNLMGTCNVCLPSEILKEYRFNTAIPISEDYDLWTRIALQYPVFQIEEYTTVYNLHDEAASSAESEMAHLKHIDAFKMMFSVHGVKKELPLKYRANLFYKRYLWLSETQKQKKKYFNFFLSRFKAAYYKFLS